MSEDTSKTESAPIDPPPHWVARYTLWSVLFVGILYLFEMEFRKDILSQTFGYEMTTTIAGNNNINFIFCGTSRTISAVDENILIKRVSDVVGYNWYGRNLAGGGNKIDNHYLGIRNLYKEHPEYMKNTTVFIESPAGLPEHMYWSDSWTFDDYKGNVIPNLRREDMISLFLSKTKLNTKLHLLVNVCLYHWRSFERRYVIRHEFLRWRSEELGDLFVKWSGVAPPKVENEITLRGKIMVDPSIKNNARALLDEFIARNREILERPWRDWEDTVVDDLVDMVQLNGGRVVFFDVPNHSNFDEIYYKNENRIKDREAFEKYCEAKGCLYIKADFEYTDDIFPDNFHVGIEQSKPFSEALSDKIIEKVIPDSAKKNKK